MPDPVPAPAAQPASPIPPAVPPAPPAPAAPPGVALVSIEDFRKIKLVTAEVVAVTAHPKADRLLLVQVKVGEQTKQIVAGIRQFYTPEQLVGRTVIVVNNLQPAKLRGEDSNGMLLAARLPDGGLRILTTDGPAPCGLEVS